MKIEFGGLTLIMLHVVGGDDGANTRLQNASAGATYPFRGGISCRNIGGASFLGAGQRGGRSGKRKPLVGDISDGRRDVGNRRAILIQVRPEIATNDVVGRIVAGVRCSQVGHQRDGRIVTLRSRLAALDVLEQVTGTDRLDLRDADRLPDSNIAPKSDQDSSASGK